MKKKSYLIVLIILVCLVGVYLYMQNTSLQTVSYQIKTNTIPQNFHNYKIIQISDYHNEKSKKLNHTLIKQIKKEKPDMIVITGDLVDSRRTDIDVSMKFIQSLKDIAPIYYVTGNHESRLSDYEVLEENLKKEGVHVCRNQSYIIDKEGQSIQLMGIDDPQMAHEMGVEDSTIIDTQIDNSRKENIFTILLSHRPEVFDTYVENKIDLVLTGHAHGGQIRIPFIGGIVAPHQGLFPQYDSGLYQQEKTHMIVSRGIGNSIFPLRVNNQPELVVVTLQAK